MNKWAKQATLNQETEGCVQQETKQWLQYWFSVAVWADSDILEKIIAWVKTNLCKLALKRFFCGFLPYAFR